MRLLYIILVLSLSFLEMKAQEVSGKFTVCTLNVDGLPQGILNPDGPGENGTVEIGKYK